MAINVDAEPCCPSGVRRSQLRILPWLALAALFAVALILRHVLRRTPMSAGCSPRPSGSLTVSVFADVIETNPPMAVLIYIPGIVIARALRLPVELVADGLVFVAVFASLAIFACILKNSLVLRSLAGWPLALLAFAILTVLPTKIFGQREHIAVVELLPLAALYAIRMKRETPPLLAILAGGIGAGLAVSFKPHFAIGILCGLAALAIHARSWRILFTPENFIAAAIAVIYGICVVAFFPEFLSVIAPLVRDIYIAVGSSFIEWSRRPRCRSGRPLCLRPLS